MSDSTAKKDIFGSADWYDRSINWDKRLAREFPVLKATFGEPGKGGIVDAGCGTARHVIAMAAAGYHVLGMDRAGDMLEVGRRIVEEAGVAAELVQASYGEVGGIVREPVDGVYCLGNALASAGTTAEVQRALHGFAGVLRPGGRLFLQILNFERLRAERPAVRGPRVCTVDGVTYISSRTFAFRDEQADVTNITHFLENGAWRQECHAGTICAVEPAALFDWIRQEGLRVENAWGSYAKDAFSPQASNDLIVVAQKPSVASTGN